MRTRAAVSVFQNKRLTGVVPLEGVVLSYFEAVINEVLNLLRMKELYKSMSFQHEIGTAI